MSSTRPRQLTAAAVVLLAIAACGGGADDDPVDVGTPVVVHTAPEREDATPTPSAPEATTARDEQSTSAPAPAVVAAEPTALTVAGETTSVVPVGVDAARTLDIPRDLDTLGWWREGALAGSHAGFVVISGHATRDGRAPANRWWQLEPGDEVTVSTAEGELAYRVTARTSYPYDRMPYDRWFPASGPAGQPALALITCSDFRDGKWHANTVVEAVPLAA